MAEFKLPVIKETYTQEELKDILNQHYNFAKKTIAEEFEPKIKELTNKLGEYETTIKQQPIEEFLKQVPETQKEKIKNLIGDDPTRIDLVKDLVNTQPTPNLDPFKAKPGDLNETNLNLQKEYDKLKSKKGNLTSEELARYSELAFELEK